MDIREFLFTVRAHLRFILFVCIAAGAAAFLGSNLLPKTYSAEARVFVGSLTDANYDQLLAYQQLAQTYAQLATTSPVLSRVIVELGLDETPDEVATRLDIRAPTGLSIVRVTATAPTSAKSVELADAVASEIANLGVATGSTTSLASVIEPATRPPSPASPRVLLNTLVAIGLGLSLAVAVAVIIEQRRGAGRDHPPVTSG